VIKKSESGISARKLSIEYQVGKTQIQDTIKRKAEYVKYHEENMPEDMKRKKIKTGFEEINRLTEEWLKEANRRHIDVTGPLLKSKALKFASDLSIADFKASQGWLQSFQKRNNLTFKIPCGERGDVNIEVVESWISRVPELIKDYAERDVYNIDETGLFFKDSGRVQTLSNKHKVGVGQNELVLSCLEKFGLNLTLT
jgi:hypothetical protein